MGRQRQQRKSFRWRINAIRACAVCAARVCIHSFMRRIVLLIWPIHRPTWLKYDTKWPKPRKQPIKSVSNIRISLRSLFVLIIYFDRWFGTYWKWSTPLGLRTCSKRSSCRLGGSLRMAWHRLDLLFIELWLFVAQRLRTRSNKRLNSTKTRMITTTTGRDGIQIKFTEFVISPILYAHTTCISFHFDRDPFPLCP